MNRYLDLSKFRQAIIDEFNLAAEEYKKKIREGMDSEKALKEDVDKLSLHDELPESTIVKNLDFDFARRNYTKEKVGIVLSDRAFNSFNKVIEAISNDNIVLLNNINLKEIESKDITDKVKRVFIKKDAYEFLKKTLQDVTPSKISKLMVDYTDEDLYNYRFLRAEILKKRLYIPKEKE